MQNVSENNTSFSELAAFEHCRKEYEEHEPNMEKPLSELTGEDLRYLLKNTLIEIVNEKYLN